MRNSHFLYKKKRLIYYGTDDEYSRVRIHSDSQVVVNAINGKVSVPREIIYIVKILNFFF